LNKASFSGRTTFKGQKGNRQKRVGSRNSRISKNRTMDVEIGNFLEGGKAGGSAATGIRIRDF